MSAAGTRIRRPSGVALPRTSAPSSAAVGRQLRAEALAFARQGTHRGMIYQGQCQVCWGWIDDPRHTNFLLLDGSCR